MPHRHASSLRALGRLFLSTSMALAVGSSSGCNDEGSCPPPPDSGVDSGTPDAGITAKNIVIVRLTTTGAIDTTYGTNGVATVDFGSNDDSLYGMAIHTDATHADKVVLFGNKIAAGATDTARVVARVAANGSGLDSGFATAGIHQLNIASVNDTARNGIVLPDGSIVASGYTSQPTFVGTMSANRIVLLKLGASGVPDATFGYNGVVNLNPFVPSMGETGMAESYGVASHASGFVTTGYGRVVADIANAVAQVNVGFGLDGQLDPAFGGFGFGATASVTVVQPTQTLESRGRNIVALPGGPTLAVGSINTGVAQRDVMVSVLDVDGNPNAIPFTGSASDASAEGERRLAVAGGVDYADEACYGAAVAPNGNFAVIAGYRTQSGMDTDAVLGILAITKDVSNVTTGVSLTSLEAVELSTTEDDHFRAVAVSPDSTRIYAAGFYGTGAAQQMVVACFDTIGDPCTGFGTGGFVTLPVTTDANAIAVDSAGRVLVAGARTDVL